ncbi:MAG: large repetitive protein, partial [Hyphomicrobiales bacterium]|nr:large repetitive protein [Hyphomicrobiales bacterium]
MSWIDVLARLKFWGVDGTPGTINGVPISTQNIGGNSYSNVTPFVFEDKAPIINALSDIYFNSPIARAMFDGDTSGLEIWLANVTSVTTPGSYTYANSRTAGIDLNQAVSFQWMGRDGRFQTENLGGNIIHELIHAITGSPDLVNPGTLSERPPWDYNNPAFDHLGPTVRMQNSIFQDMNWGTGYWQVGYTADTTAAPPGFFRTNISYTDDQTIDIAYFDRNGNLTPNNLDLSQRVENSRDLIIGLAGNDKINSGAGNDYLYGGVDDDSIAGGSGGDLLHGGDRTTNVAADGIDTADYTVGDNAVATTNGIVVKIDAASAATDLVDQKKYLTVTDDGYGNTDRLLSIEKIKGTNYSDVVNVERSDLSAYELTNGTLEIDGGDAPNLNPVDGSGGDALNFANSATAAYIGGTLTTASGTSGYATQVFATYEAQVVETFSILNLMKAGTVAGRGFIDPTGLIFTNFEKITGSFLNDRMDLWWLLPGGAPSSAQEAALQAAQQMEIHVANDPQVAQNSNDARVAAAGQIDQNKVNVQINGALGADMIQGTRTGIDTIYGGAGNDHLYAGGFTSTVYGGSGTDWVAGGGFGSILYGGDGSGAFDDTADIFDLSNNAVVKDANELDHIVWGPYHLTGGVQQWWMEGAWAYTAPFSSLISGAPLGFLN